MTRAPAVVGSILLAALLGCRGEPQRAERVPAAEAPRTATAPKVAADSAELRAKREQMVREQIEGRGVRDSRVLEAMRAVPRHAFVPESQREQAYEDHPLPIEADQTISQPYIVALMTELAGISQGQKVLEVGTGSGYQAAVLAQLGARVWSIEIVEELARTARERLRALGYAVQVRHGDGYAGWPEVAPFDAILVTAAPPAVPEPLRQQLAIGGRLIVPVGRGSQDLLVITRTETGYEQKNVLPVRFVPMTGKAQDGR
jgi:protein-L-isoaspartate(D-aspartate) O-methyltransferase